MAEPVLLLIALPVVAALLLQAGGYRWQLLLTGALGLTLTGLCLHLMGMAEPVIFGLPGWLASLALPADFAILAAFLLATSRDRHAAGIILAISQILLLGLLLPLLPAPLPTDFRLDGLARLMLLLVNLAGSVIIIYGVRYIHDEKEVDPARRKVFLALLCLFLAAMNGLALSDSLKYFFLFFEATTLLSFLLIRFRQGQPARTSSLTALWMNQLGGVALLLAMGAMLLGGHALSFSQLNANPAARLLLPGALLIVAGQVKSGQFPFDGWLTSAMVAPTPVSALLHSATMVTIGPYLLLRLTPGLTGTLLANLVMLLGGTTLVAAAVLALSRQPLKEVLALSTIAMLGLMLMLAAAGTPLATSAALLLLLFHGVAKGLLFIGAGIVEHRFGLRDIEELPGLTTRAPATLLLMVLGFGSITLPPFAAFMGKLIGLLALALEPGLEPLSRVAGLLLLALGSALLVLLYFKTIGRMVLQPGASASLGRADFTPGYHLPAAIFGLLLLLVSLLLAPLMASLIAPVATELCGRAPDLKASGLDLLLPGATLPGWLFVLPLALLLVLGYLLLFGAPPQADLTPEYNCGERQQVQLTGFYPRLTGQQARLIRWGSGVLLACLLLAGGLVP